jgi:putative ABC transport system permease protein
MDEGRVASALEPVTPDTTNPPVIAAAPFLYVVARSGNTPIVVAGTWLDQLAKLNPTWKLEGNWIASRGDAMQCFIGRNAASKLNLRVGGTLALQGAHSAESCTVAGVIDAGDNEDNQVFAALSVAQSLAGLTGRVSLAQASVGGGPKAIAVYVENLARKLPEYQVRPLRQVADAEGSLLARIRLLIVAMVILILVLTGLCVLGTMAALAMERREDVGLMKALGGSIGRVVRIFLAEVGVLGAVGGVVGTMLGFGLSYWMGLRVFGTAISPRWEVFPITVALMIVVALTGALPLRLLGRVKPAAILRGE